MVVELLHAFLFASSLEMSLTHMSKDQILAVRQKAILSGFNKLFFELLYTVAADVVNMLRVIIATHGLYLSRIGF